MAELDLSEKYTKIADMNTRSSTMQGVVNQAAAAAPGDVFTPRDFLHLGNRAAVDQSLSRVARTGTLRRLCRGLYDKPRVHPTLGLLSPVPDTIAAALARETGSQWQVSAARAANMLGLSQQVPAQLVYLTDGPARRVKVGHQVVVLKHTARKNMAGAGSQAGLVVQALRYLGRRNASADALRQVPNLDTAAIRGLAPDVAGWMRPILAGAGLPA
jgi:Family of unknown function (DUF6088)